MDPSTLTQWADIASILSGLGVTGILGVGLVLFYKGKLMSRIGVDEIKDHADAQTTLLAKELGDTIVRGMEDSTRNAIITAVKEINNR